MPYPPSGRGYRVRSLATNHFFDSGNVIFDENIPYHALHEVSSTPVDYSSLPFPSAVLHPETTTTPASPDDSTSNNGNSTESTPTPTAIHSSPLPTPNIPSKPTLHGTRTLTAAGHSYAESIASAKAHLEKLRASREQRWELKEKDRTSLAENVDPNIDDATSPVFVVRGSCRIYPTL